jgi:hypothetical protein
MKNDIQKFKYWYKHEYNRVLSTKEARVKIKNLETLIDILFYTRTYTYKGKKPPEIRP